MELERFVKEHKQTELLEATPDELCEGISNVVDEQLFPDRTDTVATKAVGGVTTVTQPNGTFGAQRFASPSRPTSSPLLNTTAKSRAISSPLPPN